MQETFLWGTDRMMVKALPQSEKRKSSSPKAQAADVPRRVTEY